MHWLWALKHSAFLTSCVLIGQKLESQVGELQASRDQAQQEVQKLHKEGSEVKRKAKELHRSLETEKTGWVRVSGWFIKTFSTVSLLYSFWDCNHLALFLHVINHVNAVLIQTDAHEHLDTTQNYFFGFLSLLNVCLKWSDIFLRNKNIYFFFFFNFYLPSMPVLCIILLITKH